MPGLRPVGLNGEDIDDVPNQAPQQPDKELGNDAKFNELVSEGTMRFAKRLLADNKYTFQEYMLGITISILFIVYDWKKYLKQGVNKFWNKIQALKLWGYTKTQMEHSVMLALLLTPVTYFSKKIKGKDKIKWNWINDFLQGQNILSGKARKEFASHLDNSWRSFKKSVINLLCNGKKEKQINKELNNVDADWVDEVTFELARYTELNVSDPGALPIALRKKVLKTMLRNMIICRILGNFTPMNPDQLTDSDQLKIVQNWELRVHSILVVKKKLPGYLLFQDPVALPPRIQPPALEVRELRNIFARSQVQNEARQGGERKRRYSPTPPPPAPPEEEDEDDLF